MIRGNMTDEKQDDLEKKVADDKKLSKKEKDEVLNKNAIEINPSLNEAPDKTVVLGWGRMNPITVGHEKLVNKIKSVARANSATPLIYITHSQDAKKNPLDYDTKVTLAKKAFGNTVIQKSKSKTIMQVMKELQGGYSRVILVVGQDRVTEFDKLLKKYNGKDYTYDSIEVVSAGDRDPDAEGVEGMSASKMRKAAMEDDFETYRTGIPDLIDDKTAKMMMTNLKRRMQVTKESWNLWEIAPRFDWKNLRENYIKGKIFNVDQLVENLNTGLVGKVIRRGTNYLICVTEDNVMFKSWIRDIREYTEVKMARKKRVPGKPNTLIGTDGYFKNLADLTPGFNKGDKTNLQPGAKAYGGPSGRDFINKYRKK